MLRGAGGGCLGRLRPRCRAARPRVPSPLRAAAALLTTAPERALSRLPHRFS